jgi:hypothetical protein
MALRGDDYLGIDEDEQERLLFLKGEAKSGRTVPTGVVADARERLSENDGRPTPISLLFVADCLLESNDEADKALGRRIRDEVALKAVPPRRITHGLRKQSRSRFGLRSGRGRQRTQSHLGQLSCRWPPGFHSRDLRRGRPTWRHLTNCEPLSAQRWGTMSGDDFSTGARRARSCAEMASFPTAPRRSVRRSIPTCPNTDFPCCGPASRSVNSRPMQPCGVPGS